MVAELIESAGPVDSSCSTSFAPGYAVGRFPVKAGHSAQYTAAFSPPEKNG